MDVKRKYPPELELEIILSNPESVIEWQSYMFFVVKYRRYLKSNLYLVFIVSDKTKVAGRIHLQRSGCRAEEILNPGIKSI